MTEAEQLAALGRLPERLRWAVDTLAVQPDDHVREIGCGSGAAAAVICERLVDGRMLAIDRSSTQIERAGRRNEAHLASGRLSLETMDVAHLDVGQTRFDKVFAVNINVFWLGSATAELAAVRRLLAPGGMLLLVYETPGPERAPEVVERLSAVLEAEAFDKPEILTPTPRLVGMKMQA